MKLFSHNSNELVGINLNKPGLVGSLNQGVRVRSVLAPGLFKFVIVGIFFLLIIIAWFGWRWYNLGFQRDNARLNQINQLVAVLQKYQNQFAVFPAAKTWPELLTKLSDLESIQDPLAPARFYFYCPTENGYLAGAILERSPQIFNQKKLTQGLALNSCLTSTGVNLSSLSCSAPGIKGEVNSQKGWVWCLGNL